MLFSKKKGLSIDTLLGEDTAIDGDLVFAGGLRLDGRVRGNIIAAPGKPSMLVVSEKGMVEGEISVGHLVLNGTVKGPVQATDLLELQPNARVLGDVRYAALEMHQGALVEGRLMPLAQGEIKALPNVVEAGPVTEVTQAADGAAGKDDETPADQSSPTEKAA
ncbi:bactofilin family protein [Cupriavidus necator]|uniref:bactofilin family protein n=1 Tax=Cupriavidus necator TaxID=106590 RepID=UPI0005B4DE96|nr:polymer-forming cytoskeletal protein [Cupriavidus necator]